MSFDGRLDCVGESFHIDALIKILNGETSWSGVALLLPEPDNSFDKAAVGVYSERQLVGYLPKGSDHKLLSWLHSVIGTHGYVAVEADVMRTGNFEQVLLEASQRPMPRVVISRVLIGAGFTPKPNEKGTGFTISEDGAQSKVFHGGSNLQGREEMVPEYVKALKATDYEARSTRDDNYMFALVTAPPK